MKRRWCACALAGLGGLVLVLALTINPLARALLVLDSGPGRAHVLVVLGGGNGERPRRALELFHQGAAPLILCSGQGDGLAREWFLRRQGMPRHNLVWEPASQSTSENARFTIAWMRQHHLKSAIIVTTWYHARRALACFKHYGPELQFYIRPAYAGYGPDDPGRGEANTYARNEFLKIPYYWLVYGVPPG